ncbi:IS256 family transposase [Hydrogenovibrio crunogenus]|jgi:transposase-like protein|uniref:Mutator family transposase n=1 Tax=Hydrogenovibrio crunogenus TaxID=39765 RepID=A0A4P7NYG4_9GAMM|nr:IS256 family transposase [Hydrogenovibrio crunogenus]QBZ82555.1 IS256 family transposase [Hydrogenovibrio crunogenus]QBZ82732.1 IS256 family transposase [Hydrogenovibrio crunogenus]QBZ82742.1 IS256 family transposase [Hydrogenovibrio crunogenus]QBZ82785.1 IS256 family transposase [Hydrogenovibrio crunogenus]
MSNIDQEKLKAMAAELAKDIKTQSDLSDLSASLLKMTVEAALGAEMEEHLGYPKHHSSDSDNSRNGYSFKTLKGDHGEVEIAIPRDRQSEFNPTIIKKGETRLTSMDDQILALYAKGMTTRDIVATFKEMYGADVSPTLISKVTEAVMEKVTLWRSRPLDEVYPLLYLDGIVIKVRQDKQVVRKTMYVALGVNTDGQKECLGLWLSETESSKFWLSVLNDLEARGVKDILVASVDGLTGFPEAINTVYPQADVQLCIVHMVRNSLRYVGYKERKQVANDLKQVYQSVTEEEALLALEQFETKWDDKFPNIGRSWRNNWDNVATLFQYPQAIRKVIYTTNAIESLNSVIRKATKNRKIFSHDNSAFKIIFLAIESASKKWTMPIRDWKLAMNQFMILHEERLKPYV